MYMNNSRLENIELKLTSQEDLLETLNMQSYKQQKKIEELEALCISLVQRLKELSMNSANGSLPHEKPPHY